MNVANNENKNQPHLYNVRPTSKSNDLSIDVINVYNVYKNIFVNVFIIFCQRLSQ